MRPRIWRPFSSNNRARMEPPSLTRWPRCPFWVLAVEDILLVSMASDLGCGADYQSQAFGIGRACALVFEQQDRSGRIVCERVSEARRYLLHGVLGGARFLSR